MNQKPSLFLFLLVTTFCATAQENSPFSRYGLGDPVPGQNIVNRGMGGISSIYATPQSVNFSNPASYTKFNIVTYDIGLTLDSRSLKSANPVQKYSSVNLTPSYVALGLPISQKHKIGLAFGLRPITKISYSIEDRKKLPGSDSVISLYQGDGGLYQAFVGLGKQWGHLSLGFNTGYMFGHKNNATRTLPVDTMGVLKSTSATNTSYGSVLFNAGLQYEAPIGKLKSLVFGISGNMKQSLNATQQATRETFTYDVNGSILKIDSIYSSPEVSGKIQLPTSFTAGIGFNDSVSFLNARTVRSSISVEYENTAWSNYRFFDQPDRLINSWQFRVGGQLTPNPFSIKSYWNRVTYRAGFYMGKEAVNADGNTLPIIGLTFGTGLPIRKWRSIDNQYTIINTAFEIGKRGNKNNNITESFFRFSVGFNLSDIWFVKRKYD